MKYIDGYTRSVRLCDYLHKGAPGKVTSGKTPVFAPEQTC